MRTELRKDGLYHKDWNYNEETGEGKWLCTKIHSIFDALKYLNWEVEVQEGVTLLNMYEAFVREDIVVLGLLCDSHIEEYAHELYNKPEEEDEFPLDSILVAKYYEVSSIGRFNDPPTDDVCIEENVNVSGKKENCEETSLSYKHWWYLKDLPIIVEKEAVFFDDRLYWNEDHTELNKHYKPEKFKSTITLYELFHSVFFELCWNGSPDKRNEFLKKIKESSQEAEDHPENLVELDLDELFKGKKDKIKS